MIEHCLKCYGEECSGEDEDTGSEGTIITRTRTRTYIHTTYSYCTEAYYNLSEEKICQFYAVLLLRQAGKVSSYITLHLYKRLMYAVNVFCCLDPYFIWLQFNYSEFMESWQQSVPLGMTTDLQQLRVSVAKNCDTVHHCMLLSSAHIRDHYTVCSLSYESSQTIALTDMSSMPPVIWYFPASTLPQDPAERYVPIAIHIYDKLWVCFFSDLVIFFPQEKDGLTMI